MDSLIFITFSCTGASICVSSSGSSCYTFSKVSSIISTFCVASSCSCLTLLYSISNVTFYVVAFTNSLEVFSVCEFTSCVMLIYNSCNTSIVVVIALSQCDLVPSPVLASLSWGTLLPLVAILINIHSPMTTND
jgi:hypothetical protein